jgi:hypothetical protein
MISPTGSAIMRFSHSRIVTLKRSSPLPAASFPSVTIATRCGLAVLALALLTGCGTVPAAATAGAPVLTGRERVAQQPPPPPWEAPVPAAEPLEHSSGASARVYSQEPLRLRQELNTVCNAIPPAAAARVLRALVADLYFSGVDPAVGTEALLLGKCGTAPEVVSEMVARGGETHAAVIVERAQKVAGSGATRSLTAALNSGLARATNLRSDDTPAASNQLPAYGMVYFPAAGEFSKVDTAIALNRLYEDAIPGYGLYTFILMGQIESKTATAAQQRTQELLRVIETYITADEQHADPNAETPAFLIPIHPEKVGHPLIEQVAFDLSASMREHLTTTLRRAGHSRLAAQLEQGSGPFLVSSLEPRLTPTDANAPHLITDLSLIGAEHLYSVIDAYDRPIPFASSGQAETLTSIRERLLALPIKNTAPTGKKVPAQNNWVSLLGQLKADNAAAARREAFNLESFSEFNFTVQPDSIRAI